MQYANITGSAHIVIDIKEFIGVDEFAYELMANNDIIIDDGSRGQAGTGAEFTNGMVAARIIVDNEKCASRPIACMPSSE